MRKRSLLIGVFCAGLSLASFGQQMSSKNHTTPQAVLAIPALKAQAEKIDQKEEEINKAATSSRAILLQLNQELNKLNQEYKTLLSDAISTAKDAESKAVLEQELTFVNQQLEVKTQR